MRTYRALTLVAPTVLALGPQLIACQIGVPDGGRGVRLLSTTGLSPPTPATRNARKQRSSPATSFAIWASPTVRVLWRPRDRLDVARCRRKRGAEDGLPSRPFTYARRHVTLAQATESQSPSWPGTAVVTSSSRTCSLAWKGAARSSSRSVAPAVRNQQRTLAGCLPGPWLLRAQER